MLLLLMVAGQLFVWNATPPAIFGLIKSLVLLIWRRSLPAIAAGCVEWVLLSYQGLPAAVLELISQLLEFLITHVVVSEEVQVGVAAEGQWQGFCQ